MTLLLSILALIGLVLLGFIIAEFQNAYLGKQEKGGIIYLNVIGITITQKDIHRLLFALSMGFGAMFLMPLVIQLILKFTSYETNGNFIYLAIGYAPSIIMFYINRKVKEKSK